MRPHVLVARLDSLGDVLLAGPAVRGVAAGAGKVTLLCGHRGRAAADLLPGVDTVVCHTAPWIDPDPATLDPAATLALVQELAALEIDQAVVLTSFHQSPLPLALLLRMAGVPTVAAISDDYPGSLLDVRHRVPDGLHEVERSLSVVATLGFHLPPGDDGRLRLRPGVASGAGSPLPATFDDYVVVHPGASVPARAWEPERWASVVDALAGDGRRVVVTGAPHERALTSRVAGPGRPDVVDLGGATDLTGLARVLSAADAVVVANTGPAHLAAATGTPVVSLFAPTVAVGAWRPWGVPHVMLGRHDVACAGCRARVCPVPGHPCLADVGVDEVVAAVDGLAVRRAPAPAAVGAP